ncbi:protein transport protein SEC31-like [Halichondria panicea]|uniref:protein transport protein SEC31-like n=1 Tax=Halichondria panicea TaxID=6063 RepID=UPI00312B5492
MKLYLLVVLIISVALATSSESSPQWHPNYARPTKGRYTNKGLELTAAINNNNMRDASNQLEKFSQSQHVDENTKLVAASARGSTSEENSDYRHHHHHNKSDKELSSQENNYKEHHHSRGKLGSRRQFRKGRKRHRLEEQLESGYERNKGSNGHKKRHHQNKVHSTKGNANTVTHTLEHKPTGNKNNKQVNTPGNQVPVGKLPIQNNWQGGPYPIPGLGYSPYNAFPYNRFPFLPPVPVLYQPPPQRKITNGPPLGTQNTVTPPPTNTPNGGNNMYPVQNIKQIEDTYSMFGNALRQLQNGRNSNLNDAQHVTYIVPYIRQLEHLKAMVYNQLMKQPGYSMPYDPMSAMYKRQPVSYPQLLYQRLNRINPLSNPLHPKYPYNSPLGEMDTRYGDLLQAPPPLLPLYNAPMRYSTTRNELLDRLQSLLDQYHYDTYTRHAVLPVNVHVHENRESTSHPSLTVQRPQNIHYYVDPASDEPSLDRVPQDHNSGPVEIHYHLSPHTDTQHKSTEGDGHYHVYLPEQKTVKSTKKIVSARVGEKLKGLLNQLAGSKQTNVQDKQYELSMKPHTSYTTQTLPIKT